MLSPLAVIAADQEGAPPCRVEARAAGISLVSPYFVLDLSTTAGLRAEAWENRLTARRLALAGPELEVDLGPVGGPLAVPVWKEVVLESSKSGREGEAVFRLTSQEPPFRARVTYRWTAAVPVLHKFVELTHAGQGTVTLLNLRLGAYRVDAPFEGRDQGFPAYLDGQCFLSLAHPAGWASAKDGQVVLQQHPGTRLAAGGSFTAMEAVYGVAPAGEARTAFLAHLRSRMRRVVRGHDRPYAIFEPFGARPDGNFDETEAFVLDMIAKVGEGQRDTGCRFDLFSVDFWVDHQGDLKRCNPERFPRGLEPILGELKALGIAPGLWIDSSWEAWSIGGNPAVQPCLNYDLERPETMRQGSWGRASFCRASEPIRSLYTAAFREHIRERGVRMLKFDNLATTCCNPRHDHLPGLYSTEAITDAVIEFLRALDAESPDVFLMLYWGYRSPWWLLHGDTLFDSGIGIEAASPSILPAPYARDSITQKLDQAQRVAADVPALGKDSLGVWLSDWGWNSQVGKARWQEGFILDLCRGSLLAQPWSDTAWLSVPERRQMADFIGLLKARPECFGNPRFILGDPNRPGPYGYCCTDGRRAFLALNNATWEDRVLTLELNAAWGLPDGGAWDLIRWYPDPARLQGTAAAFGERVSLVLRPFAVALIEVIPAGTAAALPRELPVQPIPTGFAEPSRRLDLLATVAAPPAAPAAGPAWTPVEVLSATALAGSRLALQSDGSILAGGPSPERDTYTIQARTRLAGLTGVRLEALPDPGLPGNGPGRAVNGNFSLLEFRLAVQALESPAEPAPVSLTHAAASFEQQSYGGWPVAAAIDGDPKTGWSIDPHEGRPQEAVFEITTPIANPGGSLLTFSLEQGDRQHTLGRFRLAVTAAPAPLPTPAPAGVDLVTIEGQAPASSNGGMLVITARLGDGPHPPEHPNLGTFFAHRGFLEDQPAAWVPVLGTATYPASWQAWRLEVPPAAGPRRFRLLVESRLKLAVPGALAGYYLPR